MPNGMPSRKKYIPICTIVSTPRGFSYRSDIKRRFSNVMIRKSSGFSKIMKVPVTHPITGFKDDSAYVTTKIADRNKRITEDG